MEVIGIGLANIDLVAHVSDEFLLRHKVSKGLAKKFDDLAFGRLRGDLKSYEAVPGGCVANTMCGLATAGVATKFFGKIGENDFDSLYRTSFSDYTVEYNVAAGVQESSQCAVLVTPDGERSFAYMDGASWHLSPEDIDTDALSKASLIYAEVYLFEFGQNHNTAQLVFETAQKHHVPLAMKVMDTDFGRRYAQKMKALAEAGVLKLLIGNQENLPYVAGTQTYGEAIEVFKDWKCDTLLTASKEGAYFISKGEAQHFPVAAVASPRNTAGAGDQFAAGFITGWLDNRPVEESMSHAASCARMILEHDMARPPLVTSQSISFK